MKKLNKSEAGKLGGIATRISAQQKVQSQKYEYYSNPKVCLNCDSVICYENRRTSKFCCRSCSTTYNNTGIRRHGAAPPPCAGCGKITNNSKSIYCSKECAANAIRKYSPKESKIIKRKRQRIATAHYRCKIRNQTPAWADSQAIKDFYNNCPKGYEVDHIIPVSKGGLHSMENLQYLPMSENRRKNNKIIH